MDPDHPTFCARCGKPGDTTKPCIAGRAAHEFVERLPGNYVCVGCGVRVEKVAGHCATRREGHKFFHTHP